MEILIVTLVHLEYCEQFVNDHSLDAYRLNSSEQTYLNNILNLKATSQTLIRTFKV